MDLQASYKRLIGGCLSNLPAVNSRVVRIFLSTFSDMEAERNYIMKNIYPKLKTYCRETYGMEFQTIDIPWGISNDTQLDHQGPATCYREIENCRKMSAGPFFICLLGQRYGNQLPVAVIEEDEFNNLIKALKDMNKDTSVVEQWYIKDENNVPPQYNLKPIIEMTDQTKDIEIRTVKTEWEKVNSTIIENLREAAQYLKAKAMLNVSDSNKYMVSFTEMAITYGLLDSRSEQTKYALVFIQNAIECNSENGNSSNSDNLNNIKSLILSLLPPDNVCQYSVENDNGVSEKTHKDYFADFGKDYYDNVKRLVDSYVHNDSQLRTDDLYTEVLQHSTACMNYVKKFQGRQDIIERIKSYVLDDEKAPMIVYGQSGSGKTSVLGKTASMVRDWLPEADRESAIVLLRFLGTSPGTSSIQQTLKYLCKQLACFGNSDDIENAASLDDFKELLATFYRLLERFGEFRKIIVFLDSVDQLDSSNGAYYLTWFRTELPNNVKMIVSTLPEMFDLLKTFKAKLPNENMYVEVKPLEQNLCKDILTALLFENKRKLSDVQWKFVEQAFTKCSLPIYVNLLYHQVLNWHSYDTIDDFSLKYSVRAAIFDLFNGLEARYGKLFTSHALAYITASRNGLSETELEDLISLDDDVLRDVFQYHLPPLIRIPPFCWARLRHDIGSYLVEREADNVRVVYWYHRQFIEVAQEYFLGNEEFKKRIHSAMADYFIGRWGGGKKKPFVYPTYLRKKLNLPESNLEDRIVPEQPYVLRTDENNAVTYNLRKLNELPWHLCKSGRLEEFYDYCNFDYEFLLYKLCATSRSLMLRDLELPDFENLNTIKEAEYVYNSIRLSALSLNYDPAANLGVDLVGRLTMYEKMGHPRICLLLSQIRNSKKLFNQCCMLPSSQCFDSGSGFVYGSYDIGLCMALGMPDQKILTFSIIDNEITWYDYSGTEIKSFSTDYNLFMTIKYLKRRPLNKNYVQFVTASRTKALPGSIFKDDAVEEYLPIAQKDVEDRIEELKKNGQSVPEDLQTKLDSIIQSELPESMEPDMIEKYSQDGITIVTEEPGLDYLKVDFDHGVVTKLFEFLLEPKVIVDDIEIVTDKYVIIECDKQFSGSNKLSILDVATQKYLEILENKVVATSVCGASALSISQDVLVYATASSLKSEEINTLVVHDVNNNKKFIVNIFDEVIKELEATVVADNFVSETAKSELVKARLDSFKEVSVKSRIVGVLADSCDRIGVLWTSATKSSDDKEDVYHWLTFVSVCSGQLKVDYTHMLPDKQQLNFSQPHLSGCGNKSKCAFLIRTGSNKSADCRGFIYDLKTKQIAYLDRGTDKKTQAVWLQNFGDGSQLQFVLDESLVITDGVECAMLIWSAETGLLLHSVCYGTSTALLCTQRDNSNLFAVCHFPDDSSPTYSDDVCVLYIKIYDLEKIDSVNAYTNYCLPSYVESNLNNLGYLGDSDSKTEFCLAFKDEYFNFDLNLPNIISKHVKLEAENLDKPMLTNETILFGNPHIKLVKSFGSSALFGQTDLEVDVSQHSPLLDEYNANKHLLTPFNSTFKDNKVFKLTFQDLSCVDSLKGLFSKRANNLGIFDENVEVIILYSFLLEENFLESTFSVLKYKSLEVRPAVNILLSETDSKLMLLEKDVCEDSSCFSEDFISTFYNDMYVTDNDLPRTKQKRNKMKKTVTDMAQVSKEQKLKDFVNKFWVGSHNIVDYYYDNQEKCVVIAICKNNKHSDVIFKYTDDERSIIWLGRVISIRFSDILNNWSNTNQRPSIKIGKLFDMGPAVVFLKDGKHLINYKLQMVDYIDGSVKRKISSVEEMLYYTILKISPDLKFIVGLICPPGEEIKFVSDLDSVDDLNDTKSEKEMINNNAARVVQIYQINDGRRLANYMFENEVVGLSLCGKDGRDLFVFMHNAPIVHLNIQDPLNKRKQDLSSASAVTIDSQSDIATTNMSNFTFLSNAPGPKPEYLEQLAPILASAMAAVVTARPSDPIEYLAKWLLEFAQSSSSISPNA